MPFDHRTDDLVCVRWRLESAASTAPAASHGLAYGVADHNQCRRILDVDLDLQQRHLLRGIRRLERHFADQRQPEQRCIERQRKLCAHLHRSRRKQCSGECRGHRQSPADRNPQRVSERRRARRHLNAYVEFKPRRLVHRLRRLERNTRPRRYADDHPGKRDDRLLADVHGSGG